MHLAIEVSTRFLNEDKKEVVSLIQLEVKQLLVLDLPSRVFFLLHLQLSLQDLYSGRCSVLHEVDIWFYTWRKYFSSTGNNGIYMNNNIDTVQTVLGFSDFFFQVWLNFNLR